MRFSLNWLRQWVSVDINATQLADKLSLIGLEVDHVVPACQEFTKVIVGRIVKAETHPNADKLRVCDVAISEDTHHSIVCGAANARAGINVAVAVIGAQLPGGFKIKKAKLRGVESQGMLCSASELGLAESSDGILELPEDAPLGMLLIDYLQLPDTLLDIDLTPNRGDCLSLLGVAREVSAVYDKPLQWPDCTPPKSTITDPTTVSVSADTACSRYLGQVIRNINSNATSPMWLQESLRRCGLRSIHPVVDVTNYVMLALGQPLHAFDLDKINDDVINVRLANNKETLTLLDGQSIELSGDDLVIADAKQPLALAGVMGGQDSSVSANTQHIFLESAHFQPTPIGLSARRHKLQTDSAYRFERGVDPTLPSKALALATRLLHDIVGGDIAEPIDITHQKALPTNPWITLDHQRLISQLGFDITPEQVTSILNRLDFQCEQNDTQYRVQAPSHRFDIRCDADVLEEIARLYGYENIPTQLPKAALTAHSVANDCIPTLRFKQVLVNRGYHEAITYSFVDPALQQLLFPQQPTLELVNPIATTLSHMRVSLWPGLLATLQYNQRHQQPRVRLFESGVCFGLGRDQQLQQQMHLAGVVLGDTYPSIWSNPTRTADFYAIKGDIEALLTLAKVKPEEIEYRPTSLSALHPGQAADIYRDDTYLGTVGALHPRLIKQLKIDGIPFVFELSLSILEKTQVTQFAELSKFPAIRRDIALLVDKTISYQQIHQKVLENSGDLLKNVQLFDEYVGKGIPSGQKSLALALTLQHAQRTLVDDEINAFVDNIIGVLADAFNASLRK